MTLQNHQVLQRDADDKARVTLPDGQTVELAVGGPYEVGGARDIWVGDLWLLAGQSNMEGCGLLDDPEPSQPGVNTFQSRECWDVAEEPLHWLGESPRIVHHILWGGDSMPAEPPARTPRASGAGPGLSFAKKRYAETGVPIGLIPAAHGGTSMDQWSPELKGEGDRSLYGATYARVQANGGRVAGILWYQGESDAYTAGVATYEQRMEALVAAFRQDMGGPDTPFYFVQLGRFTGQHDETTNPGWNGMREAQRRLGHTLPNSAVAAAIDLDIDDCIHIGGAGVKRLGRRLASLAAGLRSPEARDVAYDAPGRTITVTFDNVNGELQAAGRPSGFTLRNAEGRELPVIFKISLSGDTARLHIMDLDLPPGTDLFYGWGTDPYCNITDSADMAALVFGPVRVTAEA
jgi:hypothetical protein